MANPFNLSIMTPARTVYTGEVVSLIAPGECGYFGVLAHHAPLIANLVKGRITLKGHSGNVSVIRSTGRGFLNVFKNKVSLLLDGVEASA